MRNIAPPPIPASAVGGLHAEFNLSDSPQLLTSYSYPSKGCLHCQFGIHGLHTEFNLSGSPQLLTSCSYPSKGCLHCQFGTHDIKSIETNSP